MGLQDRAQSWDLAVAKPSKRLDISRARMENRGLAVCVASPPGVFLMERLERELPEGMELPPGMKREGEWFIWEKDLSPMVFIPEGAFFMGRDEKDFFAKKHEVPCREVTLEPYFIDVFPVTNRQFGIFIKDGGYDCPQWWGEKGFVWRKKSNVSSPLMWGKKGWDEESQPAAGVSWFEAMAYARWAGKDLPTEAEWEKAARGTDRRLFPWGDSLPTSRRANFDGRVGRTTPVGSYPEGVSPYGCFDLSGNVNNWCLDWFWEGFYRTCMEQGRNRSPVLDDALQDEIGLELSDKVDRGGGFATSFSCFEVLSCTDKVHWPPSTRCPWNGFRTVYRLGR